MAYILNKSNGQQLTVLNDGLTDNALTSLSLVGKNVTNFGDAQNENFVFLLENFANSSQTGGQPRSPLIGQLWYDTTLTVNRPLVFDGTRWRPLAVSWYDTTSSNSVINALSIPNYPFGASMPGDFWVDSVNKQMYVITSTGSDRVLIGPEYVPGFSTTKMSSESLQDTAGNSHPVIKTILNGEVISIHSNETFVVSPSTPVAGFSRVYRGITFKNYSTGTRYPSEVTDVVLHGMHEQLDPSYPRRNDTEHILDSWYFDNEIRVGVDGRATIAWTNTNALNINSQGSIRLISSTTSLTFNGTSVLASSSVDLGSQAQPYGTIYANNVNAATVAATNMFQDGHRVVTTATLPTVGIVGLLGTTNQVTVANNGAGVSTLSLPSQLNVTNVNAATMVADTVSASALFDDSARVITTATLPFHIATVTGVLSQISVQTNDGTVSLSFPDTVTMSNLNVDSISALTIFQNGRQVLTTATVPVSSVVGTANKVSASTVDRVVTLTLPSTVNIDTANITTSTIGRATVTNGVVTNLTATNAAIATINATNTNVSGSLNANFAGITTLAVSGDASVYGSFTSTNVFASSTMKGYNLNAEYGSFSKQLNATFSSVNTLTFSVLRDSAGVAITRIDTDGLLAANSDQRLASQKAIVTYVNDYVTEKIGDIVIPETASVPVGAVFHVAMNTPPSGFLVCDGATLSTSQYPALFAALQYTYGGSGGTFNIPDLRGMFIRGHDDGRGVDPDRAFGSTQEESFKAHWHHIVSLASNSNSDPTSYPNDPINWRSTSGGDEEYSMNTLIGGTATGGKSSQVGGSETRPVNVALLPIIKF
jgi:microcystin-dependent protein